MSLAQSNPGVVGGPATVTVPSGSSSATFTATTTEPIANYTATTQASYFDTRASATLFVSRQPALTSVDREDGEIMPHEPTCNEWSIYT